MTKGRYKRKREKAQQISTRETQDRHLNQPMANPQQAKIPGKKLNNKARRNRKKAETSISNRLRHPVVYLFGTLFASLVGLFFVPWFVALLPGPHVTATVRGIRITHGIPAGCTVHLIDLSSDKPLEYLQGKMQFKNQIDDFKFGYPMEAENAKSGPMSMQVWDIGRDANGSCKINQLAVKNTIGVQASASGNMILFSVSKMHPDESIWVAAVTDDNKTSVNPAPKFYSEGSYKYLKLGQIVQKPLTVSLSPTTDTK